MVCRGEADRADGKEPRTRHMIDGPERDVIERFAGGDETLREEAIRIFRNTLARCRTKHVPIPRGDLHFEFMSEIDSPSPDYGLRAQYRERLVGPKKSPAL